MSPVPADQGDPGLRASDADRERVAGLLGDALADGRLQAEEHHDRIDRLYATRTLGELTPLTGDLGAGKDVGRPRPAAPAQQAAAVAIVSSTEARPTGPVAGRLTAFSFLGDARLDLSHATPGEDGVDITAQASSAR